jgi:oligoribonuclease (3'-5' exoribonuclease)
MRKYACSIQEIVMALNPTHLLWLDMEMTGLSPDTDRIIEIAIVVTDADLNTVAEGPVLVVHQPDEVMDAMDNWNKGTHGKSGLIERVKASQLNEAEAEAQMLEFVKQHVPPEPRRCAATRSVRTAASWRATCRNWKPFSTTATSTSAP